jgi:hypothetical protein
MSVFEGKADFRLDDWTSQIDPLQTLALRCHGRPRSVTKD